MAGRESMLVVEKGIPSVQAIPLDQPVFMVGASTSADVFVDNPFISRLHAQIVQEGERFRIRDLDSRNGTYVNGNRISGEGHILRSGDRIELAEGQVVLKFRTRGTTLTLQSPAGTDGSLLVDGKSREVWVEGTALETPLSRKEFDVLNLLYEKRGEACSKDDIATVGWPERNGGDVGDQEIEQSIRRIRLRVEPDPSNPKYIVTVRGFGYKLAQNARREQPAHFLDGPLVRRPQPIPSPLGNLRTMLRPRPRFFVGRGRRYDSRLSEP